LETEQFNWLEKELKTAKESEKFVIVVLHHPPFSSGKHGQDSDILKLQQTLLPLLEKNTVDLVFAGHDHVCERSYRNGIYYITSGAAGAPLYEKTFENKYRQFFSSQNNYSKILVSKNQLVIDVFDDLGAELDHLIIKK
jgi:3',5'-cyclic AMP phosphodiesterase CpdA